MTKFETIGVYYQHNAYSKANANSLFHHSCELCCNRGMHIECDRCAIEAAHSMVIACFDDFSKGGKNEKPNRQ